MKNFLYIGLFILSIKCYLAFGANGISQAELNNRKPIISSFEAIELAKTYLVKEQHIAIEKYKLESLSFEYFNHWSEKDPQFSGAWFVSFDLASELPYPGSSLNVRISNSKTPKFTFFPSE